MYIITVYPLAKGVRAQKLQYYYTQPINRGTLVSIPFGNREASAIVAKSETTEDKKQSIRSADYELKPIKLKHRQIFFAQFLTACEKFSAFSGVTTGATVRALTPATVRSNPQDVPAVNSDFLQPNVAAPKANIVQDTADKQCEYINSLAQSILKNNRSLFVCAPTIADCNQLATQLKGERIMQLHSDLAKQELLENWKNIVEEKQSVLIVGTPMFLSIPRADIGQIILTAESDEAYKMNSRPYLDKANFARSLASTYKQPCLLSDRALTTETLWEYEENQLTAQHDPVYRYHQAVETKLVDMTTLSDTNDSGVRVFSPQLAKALRTTSQENQQALLFVARSGRRPFTACQDCGAVITCPQCDLPLSLIEKDGKREFVCRTCKKQYSAQRNCDNCNSWHLQPLGIGIDFVVEILEKQLDCSIYQLDTNTNQKRADIAESLQSYLSDPGSILVTTTLGIRHLHQKVTTSAVVTADSLLAIPDLSISHKLFSVLLKMREYTKGHMIIQTRSNQKEIFRQTLAGDVEDFYNKEIEQRQQFDYPPFSYLIKLQINESKERQQETLKMVKEKLSDYQLQVYPERISSGINILIRVNRTDWVDKKLLTILRSLPLAVSIDAHPRSLL